jgi:hypothetical protein
LENQFFTAKAQRAQRAAKKIDHDFARLAIFPQQVNGANNPSFDLLCDLRAFAPLR